MNRTSLGFLTVTHTTHSATTSSTEALAENADRNFLLIQNISDTDVNIKFGATAVAAEGIEIAAGAELRLDDRFVPSGAVNVIHAGTGSKVLLITEG